MNRQPFPMKWRAPLTNWPGYLEDMWNTFGVYLSVIYDNKSLWLSEKHVLVVTPYRTGLVNADEVAEWLERDDLSAFIEAERGDGSE